MAKVVITKDGTKFYHNDEGQLHRDDGPAIIRNTGEKEWFLKGKVFKFIRGDGLYSDKLDIMKWFRTNPNGHKQLLKYGWAVWPKLQ